jgi:hypothetical protein
MSVSGLHATSSRRGRRTARAITSAALVAALVSGAAGAQTQDADPAESEAKTTEQPTQEGVRPKLPEAESKSAKPAKRSNKPFTPSERIDAESAVAFPANI